MVTMALAAAGCGAGRQAVEGARAPAAVTDTPGGAGRPLAALAGREVVLLPVQRVDAGPGAGVAGVEALAGAVDGELAFALRERSVGEGWMAAYAVRGLAARNPAMGLRPDRLPLPPDRDLRGGSAVLEPLAGQLRGLAALAGARYALVPLAVRLSGMEGSSAQGGSVRAVLHLALVDVRAAQLIWAGDTAPVELPPDSPALAARLAARFADLIAPPGAE